MNKLKSYFMFSSGHRNGIFILLVIIFVLQIIILNFRSISTFFVKDSDEQTKTKWLAFQQKIDSLKLQKSEREVKLYPFNPNYITDYKGYMLGMTVEEIHRLHQFPTAGKLDNSVSDFKNVTKVSASLLNKIS